MPANPVFPSSLYNLIDFEVFVLLVNFFILTFLFYRFFLKNVTAERHESLKNHFKNIFKYLVLLTALYLIYNLISISDDFFIQKKVMPYAGSLVFFLGVFVFIKTFRLMVLQYLFLGSMRAGVPLLLVNIFSLLLSIIIFFASLSKIFGIDLTPILATSAAFSIVLGLALQDTLGNLFAGISLQVDKSFELGDWVEVQNGLVKIIGKVYELSWRSTVLVGLTDEMITLPNKLVASCQISNFSLEKGCIIRSQQFKIKIGTSTEFAKKIIEQELHQIKEIYPHPEPFAYIHELTENWIGIKAIYAIDDYGKQYIIGDQVYEKVLLALKANNIPLAHQVVEYMEIEND